VEIDACGDMSPYGSSAQEAYKYLDYGQFTFGRWLSLLLGLCSSNKELKVVLWDGGT